MRRHLFCPMQPLAGAVCGEDVKPLGEGAGLRAEPCPDCHQAANDERCPVCGETLEATG